MKPLGRKAYGHIGHLPTSRMGLGDHAVHEGQARIATVKVRDRHDEIVVQEKLDGSCCAVACVNEKIVALGRAGYLAQTSPFEQHQLFAAWVREHEERFYHVLTDGLRVVGEWLAQAHGTRYNLPHEPFVPFDVMEGVTRHTYADLVERLGDDFTLPRLLHRGGSFGVDDVLGAIVTSGHGAIDPVEGAVWRVERHGKVDFLCKYVRPNKQDGIYLPEISGNPAVWNWRPAAGGGKE